MEHEGHHQHAEQVDDLHGGLARRGPVQRRHRPRDLEAKAHGDEEAQDKAIPFVLLVLALVVPRVQVLVVRDQVVPTPGGQHDREDHQHHQRCDAAGVAPGGPGEEVHAEELRAGLRAGEAQEVAAEEAPAAEGKGPAPELVQCQRQQCGDDEEAQEDQGHALYFQGLVVGTAKEHLAARPPSLVRQEEAVGARVGAVGHLAVLQE
mmetsp:Transcript_57132/g.158199  ORF Transcript_57132/g.158199 Transcript_57132/m.158199 type:complete len:206 (+) Transcript_57132:751-1368(+)